MRRRHFLLTALLLPGLAGRARRRAMRRPCAARRWPSRAITAATPNSAPSGGMSPACSIRRTRDIGFQLTFFRSRSGSAEHLDSPIAPRQILFAHAAVTRPGSGLLHAERAARANLGSGFSATDCDIHIGSWHMRRAGGGRMSISGCGRSNRAFGLDLPLVPTQPLLLQGEGGWSQKGPRPELASHYVSWPQLQVDGQLAAGQCVTPPPGVAPGSTMNGRRKCSTAAASAGTGSASTSTMAAR